MAIRRRIPPGYKLIFRATIRTRSGRIIRASTYGLRAFPLLVKA